MKTRWINLWHTLAAQPRLAQGWDGLLAALWAAALIGLPLTSFPFFVERMGAIVAPFSALPIGALLVLAVLPGIFRQRRLPRETLPLVLFAWVALLAAAQAFFLDLPTFKEKTIFGQEVRALLTLAIGVAFYLTASSFPNSPARLRRTLQWIHAGGLFMLLYTSVQVFYLFQADDYPAWWYSLQDWLAVKPPFFAARGARVSALAYEASWFAHQMVILYLPLWLAATLERTSVFSLRLLKFLTLENLLAVVGLAFFFLSSPRIGLLSLLLIFGYIFGWINWVIYRAAMRRLQQWLPQNRLARPINVALALLLLAAFVGLYAGLAGGVIRLGSERDHRFAALVQSPPSAQEIQRLLTLDENTLMYVGLRLQFMERTVYWLNGLHVFERHPWLGVGPGNAGFYFKDLIPWIGWTSFEIREVIYRLPHLPNIKNFWIRLLAETGLIGFGVFGSWLFVLAQAARRAYRSSQPAIRLTGLMGVLMLLAFVGEGFSIDSFAMPYFWLAAGLVVAAVRQAQAVSTHGTPGTGVFVAAHEVDQQRQAEFDHNQ
jgi:hypothetical protein